MADQANDSRLASRQVADDLQARIDADEFQVGAALPPYRQLAAEYGVATNTAMVAVQHLRDLGVVSIRPSAGAYVRDRSADPDTSAELRLARVEISELRTDLARVAAGLAKLEDRLAKLPDPPLGDDQ